jgi:hypothetical protein
MMGLLVDRSTTSEYRVLPLSAEIEAVEALCRQTLDADYRDLAQKMAGLPQDPASWMALLSGIPDDRRRRRLLAELCEEAERLGACPPGSIERFGTLQASLAALPRLEQMDGHDSLGRQFCVMIRRVASRNQGWGRHFRHDSDAFAELARIVTFRRYHAGQISFDVMATPRAWTLRVHPLALPSLFRELAVELRGLGPIVMPHLNYWRVNPLTILKKENSISHHRIVQYMEEQPHIKGLVSASWLYSSDVEKFSPHIAWLRDFYADNGAYLLDMEVAHQRAGFLVGSEARRKLHAEGKLRPRETLVIWPRERMLAWARENPQVYDVMQNLPEPKAKGSGRPEPKWKSKANETISSGQYTLVNLGPLLRDKPRQYIFLIFGIPLIVLAIVFALTIGMLAIFPALALAFAGIWLFQYFFLQ